jgi:hypothetical protein
MGTCDDPTTTSGTYPPTAGTYPPTSGTRTTLIIDPPFTSGTNLTGDMLATCLPKKFTKLPEKTDSLSLSGLCGGGVFIYTQSYTITI